MKSRSISISLSSNSLGLTLPLCKAAMWSSGHLILTYRSSVRHLCSKRFRHGCGRTRLQCACSCPDVSLTARRIRLTKLVSKPLPRCSQKITWYIYLSPSIYFSDGKTDISFISSLYSLIGRNHTVEHARQALRWWHYYLPNQGFTRFAGRRSVPTHPFPRIYGRLSAAPFPSFDRHTTFLNIQQSQPTTRYP